MANNDIQERIIDLEKEIAALPPGSVSKKTIKGDAYETINRALAAFGLCGDGTGRYDLAFFIRLVG